MAEQSVVDVVDAKKTEEIKISNGDNLEKIVSKPTDIKFNWNINTIPKTADSGIEKTQDSLKPSIDENQSVSEATQVLKSLSITEETQDSHKLFDGMGQNYQRKPCDISEAEKIHLQKIINQEEKKEINNFVSSLIKDEDISGSLKMSLRQGNAEDVLKKLSQKINEVYLGNESIYTGTIKVSDYQFPSWLEKALIDKKITHLSRIQELVIPLVLCPKPVNIIAQSQNGTGKTITFLLTCILSVTNNPIPQAIILAPTHELVYQIDEEIQTLLKYNSIIKTQIATKAINMDSKTKLSAQIIVGTPGTVLFWLSKYKNFDPREIKTFVMDEADFLLEPSTQGGNTSLRIEKSLAPNCLHMMFSATFPDYLVDFASSCIKNPFVFRVHVENLSLDSVDQYYTKASNYQEKFIVVKEILSSTLVNKVVIFTNTRETAFDLHKFLSEKKFSAAVLTGKLTAEERSGAIEYMKSNPSSILIATDVYSRGIDIVGTNFVINFDLPIKRGGVVDSVSYLHRVGRTGRFGNKGRSITIVTNEKEIENIKILEVIYNNKIELIATEKMLNFFYDKY